MAEQAKKYSVPIWAVVVAIVATIVLMKFCGGSKNVEKIDTASIKKQHIEDSISLLKQREIYEQHADSLKRVAIYYEFQYTMASARMGNVISENQKLINKRNSPPFGQIDTTQVIVPQEFINDCEGCFAQLEKTNDSAIAYKQETEALHAVMQAQNEADSQRIAQLEAEKLRLNKDYNDMRIAAEVNAKYLEPRRKVKTGLIGTFGNSFLPTGVGVGLMYEDKKDRNFGLEATFGNRPPMYEAFMYVPFTLRNK